MRPLKVFISSPVDVSSERSVVRRVIERLAIEYAYHFQIELVMSELEPMVATQTPQASIISPSSTDIVIVLLWSRLGTPLPKDARFSIDGESRQPTGTEWEFFDSHRAHRASGRPDLLVYRKTEKVTADLADEKQVLDSLQQKRELERFLNDWFLNPDGTWKAWFHSFEKEEELEHLIDNHLRKMIEAKIARDPRTDDAPRGNLIEGNPYRGLQSFNLEDAPLFFGRATALNELREVLETQNALRRGFLIVTGGSGSGKSSLLKAGLLADLRYPNRIGRVAHCRHATMRPSDHSGQLMLSIGHALLADTAFPELTAVGWSPKELATVATQEPQRVIDALRHAAGVVARGQRLRDASDVRLCIIIDQLEELFTAGIPRSAINEFTRLITLLARSEIIWVIASLRSDFYHRLDDLPDLLLLAERGYYRLKAPSPTELGQMIRKPAQLAGLRFENHPETGVPLDAVLQDDAVSDPTALPLLEFALTELWNQRSADGLLTFDAYERMGRMTGAIAERAEGLIATMSTATQTHLAPTLRALITVSGAEHQPTAATVNRSRIAGTFERAEILDSLIAARLVMTDDTENRGDPRCRFTHEKLLETWPRLKKLAQADRQFLEVRDRLRTAAEAWAGRDRAADLLLPRGTQLSEGEAALKGRRDELDALTVEYVETSVKVDSHNRYTKLRNTRLIAAGFAGLAIVSLAMLGLTLLKQSELVSKEREAQLSADRANRGLSIAMQAAAVVSRIVGAGSANIEGIFTTADNLVEETVKVNTAAPDEVLVERAALLLSFAATSERVGNYGNQLERIMLARGIVDQLCGQDAPGKTECRAILADTYEAEGNYLWRIDKPTQASRAYEIALQNRPSAANNPADTLKLVMARARTLANLSRTQLSEKLYAKALETATLCEKALSGASPTRDVKFGDGVCHLRAAQAATESEDEQKKSNELDKALELASQTEKRFNDLPDRERMDDVATAEMRAETLQTLGVIYSYRRDYKEAERCFTRGVELLGRIVRSNPQNDNLAQLFNDLLYRQTVAYRATGRNELAAISGETRRELAESRLDTPRSTYWREQQLASMEALRGIYSELARPRDAFAVADREVELRREQFAKEPQSESRLTDLTLVLFYAGKQALAIPEGAVAYQRYREALELSERQIADRIRSSASYSRDDYSILYSVVFHSIDDLSSINASTLLANERVQLLEYIVAHIERHANAEPRVITYRQALGRALYQLAVAQEQAGNLAASLAAHERASKAGWRASTIVMRRWFLEGYKSIGVNLERARDLETLANRQTAIAHWDIPTKMRSDGTLDKVTVYLEEPGSNIIPIADEAYRLRRFLNREITPEGQSLIDKIYKMAQDNKESVAALLQAAGEASHSSTGMPTTAISEAVQQAEKLIEESKAEEAYRVLVAARERLIHDRASVNPEDDVLAWGNLAEMFGAVAKLGDTTQTSLKTSARADEKAAFDRVMATTVEGSSLRLELASNLELLARRASGAERYATAIQLYERANTLRRLVRIDDPKNANCACFMATNFNSMSAIYGKMGAQDNALRAKRAAVEIHEEQAALFPDADWETIVASEALELADLYGKRREPRSALFYAQRATEIRASSASDPSADSKIRILYAAALEDTSIYAHSTALLVAGEQKNEEGRQLYKQAIDNLFAADEIRQSVLAVDPSNGECRCHVAANLYTISSYYKELGQKDQWLSSLLDEVAVRRRQVAEEPDALLWKINLVNALGRTIQALTGEGRGDEANKLRAEEVDQLEKVVGTYRPMLGDPKFNQDEVKKQLHKYLISLSFNALFVGKYDSSLAAANEALRIDSGDLVPATNRAHALMYLGRTSEARDLYIKYMGHSIGSDSIWDREILDDFRQLIDAGRKQPLMSEITTLITTAANAQSAPGQIAEPRASLHRVSRTAKGH
jgi:tetratricopeptide (TPR) repeat protein